MIFVELKDIKWEYKIKFDKLRFQIPQLGVWIGVFIYLKSDLENLEINITILRVNV